MNKLLISLVSGVLFCGLSMAAAKGVPEEDLFEIPKGVKAWPSYPDWPAELKPWISHKPFNPSLKDEVSYASSEYLPGLYGLEYALFDSWKDGRSVGFCHGAGASADAPVSIQGKYELKLAGWQLVSSYDTGPTHLNSR